MTADPVSDLIAYLAARAVAAANVRSIDPEQPAANDAVQPERLANET